MQQPNIDQQNAAVTRWKDGSYRSIKNSYMSMINSPKRSGDGLDSLKMKAGKTYGEIDRVSMGFLRYLVWRHKGAGNGQGGAKGSTWRDRAGNVKRTDSRSLGKMNSGSRHAAEWLNPVLDREVPKLADIVAGFKGDAAVKMVQIK